MQVSIAQELTGGASYAAEPAKSVEAPSERSDSSKRFRKELPEGSEAENSVYALNGKPLDALETPKTAAAPANFFGFLEVSSDADASDLQATESDGNLRLKDADTSVGWTEPPVITAEQAVTASDATLQHPQIALEENLLAGGTTKIDLNAAINGKEQTSLTEPGTAEEPQNPAFSTPPVVPETIGKVNQTPAGSVLLTSMEPLDEADINDQTFLGADAEFGVHSSGRPAHSTSTGGLLQQSNTGPSFVRGVAVQIAQALPNGTDRSVEITLDPIELGKVRLTLNMTNSGMAVQVLADRPETLELMRKNSDALIAEFREMGYADVGFEFTQNHDGTPAEDQTQPRVWAVPSGVLHQIEGPDLPSGARQLGQGDQLDLRL